MKSELRITLMVIPKMTITLTLEKQLDLSSVECFIDSWTSIDFDSTLNDLVIDFRNTMNVDTSGIEALSSMYRTLRHYDVNIRLINLDAEIKRLLCIYNFDLNFEFS